MDLTGPAVSLVLAFLLPFWLIGLVYYLILLSDINRCRENRLFWLALILLFGPFAIAWYKAARKPRVGEAARGDTFYNLARHLMLPWSIYLFVYPVLFFIYDMLEQGLSLWGEYLFWLALVILVAVLPLWLVTMLLMGIIRLTRAKRHKSKVLQAGEEISAN